jgi:hypothetical protein
VKRFLLLFVAPLGLIAALAAAPLASGSRTLYLRDVLNTHLALRAHLASALRAGELPLIDPLRAGGQALVGNPNALPLYPDNLLLLFASPLWQLNAHFWLHGLVALVAMYALARRWGIGREGAAGAAAAYGFSGYLLAQMNLYNGVAGAALAPALAAALLATRDADRLGRAHAALGILWALELVAGDPVVAAIALGVALALALPDRRRIGWGRAALALTTGTLVAAPQLVETARLVAASYRGFWGYDPGALVKTTPDPRALLDLALPLFFGRPDRTLGWSEEYFGGAPPLYYSLAPGLVAIALAVAGARGREPGRDRRPLVLGLLAGSLVLAFSRPWIGAALGALPGGSLFRFPVKLVLAAAIATSLLAGRGAERLAAADRAGLTRAFGILAGVELALLALFAAPGNLLEPPFRALFVAGVGDALWERLRAGWAGVALLQSALAALAIGLLVALRRRPRLAAAALLLLHAGSQLLLLRGMLPTDAAAFYARPPELLARLPREAVLAHGGSQNLVGPDYPASAHFPDDRSSWLFRRSHADAFSYAAMLDGRRYELNVSPEGLDSFLVQSIALSLQHFDDARKLRVLSATGVDLLLAPVPLDVGALGLAELVETRPGVHPLYVYRLAPTLADAQLLGAAIAAPHVNAGLSAVLDPGFDPRRTVVVAGEADAAARPGGTARVERFAAEEIVVAADSPAGGFVVVRRAWLPIWEAEIDGVAAKPRIANLTRLAVEVPAGAHRVRFFVDRGPFRLALAGTLAGLAALVAFALRRPAARAAGC